MGRRGREATKISGEHSISGHHSGELTAVIVLDHVQGFKRKAVLRWRLAPGNWSQNATDALRHGPDTGGKQCTNPPHES